MCGVVESCVWSFCNWKTPWNCPWWEGTFLPVSISFSMTYAVESDVKPHIFLPFLHLFYLSSVFQKEPPSPPSQAQALVLEQGEENYLLSLKRLFTNPGFVVLTITYGEYANYIKVTSEIEVLNRCISYVVETTWVMYFLFRAVSHPYVIHREVKLIVCTSNAGKKYIAV